MQRRRINPVLLSAGLLKPVQYSQGLDLDTPHAVRKWQAMATLLSAMVEDARPHNLGVAVVYLPTRFQYDRWSQTADNSEVVTGTRVRAEWLTETAPLQHRLADGSRESRAPFLDLMPTFRAAIGTQGPLNWPIDSHWNPEDHRVAAEAIAAWLR